jgi:hypothetical protein
MRRSVIILALMATTAIIPRPAYAGPAVGFVIGALGGTGAALSSLGLGGIGFGVGIAQGSAFAGTLFGGIAVKTVVGLGLSALVPKPSLPAPAANMVNYAQPISYAEWVFGRVRKGGPLGFTGFQDDKRYYVPIIAAHSSKGPVEHWLDETPVSLDPAVIDDTASNIADGVPQASYGRIDPLQGQAGQVVNAGLDAAFAQITSAHDFAGLSGAVLWASRTPNDKFSEVYPNGREWAYAPVWDGHDQIYDPRDDARKYTNNAALVLAFWITEVLGQNVDWDEVAIEADFCDTLVTNAEGLQQPIWTLNGFIRDDEDFETQRSQMAVACDAFLYERADGKVGFRVGRWIEPDITLTAEDFFALEITEGSFGSDAPTEVSASYIEPENKWREAPSGVWIEVEDSRTVREEPQLFKVNSHNQITRLNRRIARMKNPKYSLRGSIGLMGYELIGKRFVRVVHDEMGVEEYFEIGELSRDAVSMFSITANSVSPDDFALEIVEPARPVYTEVSSSNNVPLLTGLSAISTGGGRMDVDWTVQNESLTQQLRVRIVGEDAWQIVGVPDGQQTMQVSGLIDLATYQVQGRNRTAALRPSDWGPEPEIEVAIVNNQTPPAALASAGATGSGAVATCTWVGANDANQASVAVLRATGAGGILADAVEVATIVSPANASGSYPDEPAAGSYRYWLRPGNSSGVEGPVSGPFAVTIV